MRWTVALVALACIAVAALSGCVSIPCTQGPLVSARGIGPGTGHEGGDGDATLAVAVRDPAGAPIPGAGVVVYWGRARAADYVDELRRDEAGRSGEVVQPGHTAGTPGAAEALRLRSRPDGTVLAHVPADHLVGVVAAADGYTEEWVGYVATPAAGHEGQQEIRLYPLRVTWEANGTWSPGALSTGSFTGGGYAWLPQDVPLPGGAAGYLARLVSVRANVSWQNEATGAGDLAIGLGNGHELRAVGDEDYNMQMGAQSEELGLGLAELREYGLHQGAGLQVAPATGTALVAPLGLPYRLHLELLLDRAGADPDNCLYVAWGKDSRDGSRNDNGAMGASVQPKPIVRDAPVAGNAPAVASPAPVAALGALALLLAALPRRRAP